MFKSRKLPNQIWSRQRCRCHISWVPSSASWGLPQVVHHLHSKIPWFAISCVPCHALLHSLHLLRSMPCAPRVELLTGWQQACAGKKRLALHFRLRITRCREINEFCETNFFWLSSLTSAINSSNRIINCPSICLSQSHHLSNYTKIRCFTRKFCLFINWCTLAHRQHLMISN